MEVVLKAVHNNNFIVSLEKKFQPKASREKGRHPTFQIFQPQSHPHAPQQSAW